MRGAILFLFAFLSSFYIHAQLRLSASGGMMNYQGDLKSSSFTFYNSNPYISIGAVYPMSNHFAIRGGFGFGRIEADDKNNRDYLKLRNLNFQSPVQEASLSLEYTLLNIDRFPVTPYAYGGITLFHFNPATLDAAGNYVRLQPLGTEGQGLAAYPEKKTYKLTQMALHFGGGVRAKLSRRVNGFAELCQRITMTDYLDDVSGNYADPDLLLTGRGAKAAELAFRGDELNPPQAFPGKDQQRGTPAYKDWYYTFAVGIEIKLGRRLTNNDDSNRMPRRSRGRYGCPAVRL